MRLAGQWLAAMRAYLDGGQSACGLLAQDIGDLILGQVERSGMCGNPCTVFSIEYAVF